MHSTHTQRERMNTPRRRELRRRHRSFRKRLDWIENRKGLRSHCDVHGCASNERAEWRAREGGTTTTATATYTATATAIANGILFFVYLYPFRKKNRSSEMFYFIWLGCRSVHSLLLFLVVFRCRLSLHWLFFFCRGSLLLLCAVEQPCNGLKNMSKTE